MKTFTTNAKKILLFLEEPMFFEHRSVLDDLMSKEIETEIYIKTEKIPADISRYIQDRFPNQRPYLSNFSMTKVSSILRRQVIGTRLFISGTWTMIHAVKEKAYQAGFSEDEIQAVGIGPKEENVFCVKCYTYNVKQNEHDISCEHCHTSLYVSNHFSKRHDAYLGYIKLS